MYVHENVTTTAVERFLRNAFLKKPAVWSASEVRYQNRLASAKIRDYLKEQLPQQEWEGRVSQDVDVGKISGFYNIMVLSKH